MGKNDIACIIYVCIVSSLWTK